MRKGAGPDGAAAPITSPPLDGPPFPGKPGPMPLFDIRRPFRLPPYAAICPQPAMGSAPGGREKCTHFASR